VGEFSISYQIALTAWRNSRSYHIYSDDDRKMTNHEKQLSEALLDALCLEWQDNGNISAEAVRDQCIQTLADVLGMSFPEIAILIEQRAFSQ